MTWSKVILTGCLNRGKLGWKKLTLEQYRFELHGSLIYRFFLTGFALVDSPTTDQRQYFYSMVGNPCVRKANLSYTQGSASLTPELLKGQPYTSCFFEFKNS